MNRRGLFLQTIWRLGPSNVATVALYRLALRSGLLERRMPIGKERSEPFFVAIAAREDAPTGVATESVVCKAERLLKGQLEYFSNDFLPTGAPPDWFLNPFTNHHYKTVNKHWSRLDDFDTGVGDIKTIWEASRLDWTLLFARAYRLTGDNRYLAALNSWIADWTTRNPLNAGPNWKCGQETSIRLLHVLLTAFLLRQEQNPTHALMTFVAEHARRVEPTIRYAIAQDNNHGTSEAAGLFVAGAWLKQLQTADAELEREAQRWHAKGRYWLENRVKHLIERDGSFSQYSLNYHRVLLDTLSIVEFWRLKLQQPPFSEAFYERARAATFWLYQMVDPVSGDGPNLGANDGARLFPLASSGYRDYRPSVQLGMALFHGERAYPPGVWDEPLYWLQLPHIPEAVKLERKSCLFRDGGYVTLHGEDAWAAVRFPNFRFRPGVDAHHLDLWAGGENVLRGSGSYSYNSDANWRDYFGSTEAQNTVQFDERDQMPRLGRFLRGAWLKADEVSDLMEEDGVLTWEGSYTDYQGCRHKRAVSVEGRVWRVRDELAGFTSRAVLRWRLLPGDWHLGELSCQGRLLSLNISANVPIARFELVEGWESRHYQEKTSLPVLEIEVHPSKAVLETEIRLR